ncbi:MAG TPA: hypothetical protein VMZ30_18715 [Pyrinomonadaceae bacterium]|nr:hypothetical protein [Pyrinomonadaceae bacterium]
MKLIEQLQPKPEYLDLFREIVLDVWKKRHSEAIKLAATLQSRVEVLKLKRQRVIDAFLHERSLDKPTYQKQLNLVNEEITLTELEIHDSKLEELDLEAALNFAINALSNARAFWIQCSADQKQRFQRVLYFCKPGKPRRDAEPVNVTVDPPKGSLPRYSCSSAFRGPLAPPCVRATRKQTAQ